MLPYVMTAFENASPMEWDSDETSVTLKPLFDHERGTGNRQLTHWHVKLCAKAGAELALFIPPAENIYGGKRVNAFVPRIASVYSADARTWTPLVFERVTDGSLAAKITMPEDEVFIARAVPYTTSHLAALIARIKNDSRVTISTIGKSAEGRDLTMLSLSGGPKHILLRGRAHPWESGGSWFIDGVIDGALAKPEVLAAVSIDIMPMAGIDGVIHGTTRFNSNGIDLNRSFRKDHRFADGAPENLALVRWLEDRELNTNWLPAVRAVPLDTTWREFGARFAAMMPEFSKMYP